MSVTVCKMTMRHCGSNGTPCHLGIVCASQACASQYYGVHGLEVLALWGSGARLPLSLRITGLRRSVLRSVWARSASIVGQRRTKLLRYRGEPIAAYCAQTGTHCKHRRVRLERVLVGYLRSGTTTSLTSPCEQSHGVGAARNRSRDRMQTCRIAVGRLLYIVKKWMVSNVLFTFGRLLRCNVPPK